MFEVTAEFWLCDDCTIVAANDDYSGMDESKVAPTREWLVSTGPISATDEHTTFKWAKCPCCEVPFGTRTRFVRLEQV